jgi:RNA polymerase-binding transcription factor DksA
MHLADSATDEIDHDLAANALNSEQELLYEIEQAIRRILDGTYGKCQVTGKRIPSARLHAVPWTPFRRQVEEELETLRAAELALE